nr:MAG TPA: hypothetical protein [Bacteriophage sp.]
MHQPENFLRFHLQDKHNVSSSFLCLERVAPIRMQN